MSSEDFEIFLTKYFLQQKYQFGASFQDKQFSAATTSRMPLERMTIKRIIPNTTMPSTHVLDRMTLK